MMELAAFTISARDIIIALLIVIAIIVVLAATR